MSRFYDVAVLADELAGEGSRLKKRAAIAEAIGRVAAESVEEAGLFALYLAGEPFPESDQRKLNAGGALLSRALLAVSGAGDAALTAAYRRHGDMGAAAFDLLENHAPAEPSLTLPSLAEIFASMASAATTRIRADLLEELLRQSTAVEAKYLLKLMLGDMRIGVKQSLVEEAIAVAAGAEVAAVRHAVMLEADLAWAVRRAFGGSLADARMRLFHPLGFMLASPVETPEEAVERFTAKPEKKQAAKAPAKRRGKAAEAALREALEAEGGLEPGAADVGTEGQPAEAYAPTDEAGAESFADAAPTDTIGVDSTVDDVKDPEAAAAAGDGGAAPLGNRVEAYLEDKYDGMRAQLHCGDPEQPGRVALYSRNREDVTESFPEIAEAFAHVGAAGTGPLILDGEILGWDLAEARALPFAVLSPRLGRKRVSNEVRQAIPVVFMCFDLLYADGDLTLHLPLAERRNRLEAVAEKLMEMVRSPVLLPETPKPAKRGKAAARDQNALFAEPVQAGSVPGLDKGVARLLLSPARLVETAEEIDRAYAEARARANEGVMLKAAGSSYLPGRRGLLWVKLKRELATLDVVITGAEYGSGRRAQFLSDYTFAVRGPGGELLNVGKAYSGVTDAEIVELTEWLKAHTIEDFGHFRTVEPGIVLEVAFNNIMRSDRHASGFALRFPRILRLRHDKPVAEIDTVERVEEVYQSQVDKPVETG